MDISESTRIVFQRIQKLDPENVTKIIGHLLLDDRGEQEMLRLAFGSDDVVRSLIEKVKRDLGASSKPLSNPGHVSAPQEKKTSSSKLPLHFTPFTPASHVSLPSPVFRTDHGQWNPQIFWNQLLTYNIECRPSAYLDSTTSQYGFQPPQLSYTAPHSVNNYCHEYAENPMMCHGLIFNNFHPGFHDFHMNICEQFNQGYCKYGGSCRFLHVLRLENGHDMILNPPTGTNVMHNCHAFRNRSLKDLEIEIVELLKSKRGQLVLISSIPMLYHEKYGRMLQTEYCYTESQWKGSIIYCLIQLAQMSDKICLVHRPNGQQFFILVDDIPRYMRSFREKNEPGASVEGSCQVYLTFTPDSTVNEQDILYYFNNFGLVKEVKIPTQEKIMYGFVTFAYPETVRLVLSKGNPHFICGAQVLVKPYKPRSMLFDRKLEDKMKHHMQNTSLSHVPDAEFKSISSKSPSTSGPSDDARLLKNQEVEHELPVKLKQQNSEIENTDTGTLHSFFSYTFDSFSLPQGTSRNGFKSGDTSKICKDDYDFQEVNLPNSPFRCEAGGSSSSLFFLE